MRATFKTLFYVNRSKEKNGAKDVISLALASQQAE